MRIGRVEVAPLGPSGDTWDGPVAEPDVKGMCKLAGTAASFLLDGGATGSAIANVGCELVIGSKQRQSDPRDPDLVVRLSTPEVEYRSYVAIDRTSHLFNYAFVIPAAALTKAGLVVTVADADDDDRAGREIGSVRLDFEALVAAARTGEMVVRRSEAGGVLVLEMELAEYVGDIRKVRVPFKPATGVGAVEKFPIAAGEVVRIEAAGRYRTSSSGPEIGPEGHRSRDIFQDNLPNPAFAPLSHGGAIAVVGSGTTLQPFAIAPCERIVTASAGAVFVGVNDAGPPDNSGTLNFRLVVRGPTANEWKRPGRLLGCR